MGVQRFYGATGDAIARLDGADGDFEVELFLQGSGAQCLAVDPSDRDTVYAGLREGGVRHYVGPGGIRYRFRPFVFRVRGLALGEALLLQIGNLAFKADDLEVALADLMLQIPNPGLQAGKLAGRSEAYIGHLGLRHLGSVIVDEGLQ